MQALVLDDGGLRFEEDRPEPPPVPGEVRVAVRAAGVCATDLALLRGYAGDGGAAFRGVLGHEFVGTALEGPSTGKRVVGEINAGCGRCARCRAGDPRHCPGRTVLGIVGRDGAFAQVLRLPQANLLEVPDGVSDAAAVLVEPLAAAYGVLERLGDGLPDEALVVGDGRLGLLCAIALADAGLAVDVLGRHPEREALFDGVGGRARHLGRPLDERAPDRRYPLVVEASGRADLVAHALGWVAPRGTLVLKTTTERPSTLSLSPLVVEEVAVVGSRCGRFAPALAALARGVVPAERFVTERHRLADGPLAFERAARGGVLKVVFDILAP